MVSDGAGNFWGTTEYGGAYSYGTVFKINAATGYLTTVVSFTGSNSASNRGANPCAGVATDGSGNFWGTTNGGGAYGYGTIYKINAATGAMTTLFDFSTTSGPGTCPYGTLASDGSGNFWGTTSDSATFPYGGPIGAIYKINAATGIVTTVYNLTNATGYYPEAGLLYDGAGNFWGTATCGGDSVDYGTVFEINAATGLFEYIYAFPGSQDYPGEAPFGGLVDDGAGNLWGTTYFTLTGRSTNNWLYDFGTIFKVKKSSGAVTIVQSFTGLYGTTPGANPTATLVPDGKGYVWGVSSQGGINDFGTLFGVSIATGKFYNICAFNGGLTGTASGYSPYGGMVNDGAGYLWGTTAGTIFKVNTTTGVLTTVNDFFNFKAPPGSTPSGTLASDGSGNFWGTTGNGGAVPYGGTVFKVNAATKVLTNVLEFTGSSGSAPGSNPNAGLISDGAGNVWGTTVNTPLSPYQLSYAPDPTVYANQGTVFKINTATGKLTTVVAFTGTNNGDAGNPYAGLTSDGAGNFWGITSSGGSNNDGTIFEVNSSTGNLTTICNLTDGATGRDGGNLYTYGSLVSDGAGNFWGTSWLGSSVYKVNATTGNLTVTNVIGNPISALVSDGAGNLLSTTTGNGAYGYGMIFKVNEATGNLATVYSFPEAVGAVANSPCSTGALTNDGAGNFWGTTEFGGINNLGTVFKINEATGVLTTVFDFTGVTGNVPGANPRGTLVIDGAGNLWGTASAGGELSDGSPAGGGEIFMINIGPAMASATASGITASSAILSGTVNPNMADTTAYFQIGTTGTYGATVASQDIGSGTSPVTITGTATGLLPGTTYHYQLVASNTNGLETTADQTFTTPGSYAYWNTTWFGTSGSSGDLVVNNNTGVPNLLCYALGLNPFAARANCLPSSATAQVSGSSYLIYNFTRNTQATDVSYIVEASDNLADPTAWAAINTFSAGAWSPSSNVTETGTCSNVSVQVQDPQPIGVVPARALRLIITH